MEYENALEFLLYSYFGFDGGTKKIEDNKTKFQHIVLSVRIWI